MQTAAQDQTRTVLDQTSHTMVQIVSAVVTDVLQRSHSSAHKDTQEEQIKDTQEEQIASAALAVLVKASVVAKSMAGQKREKDAKMLAAQTARLEEKMLGRFVAMVDYFVVEQLYQGLVTHTVEFARQAELGMQSKRPLFSITFTFVEKTKETRDREEGRERGKGEEAED